LLYVDEFASLKYFITSVPGHQIPPASSKPEKAPVAPSAVLDHSEEETKGQMTQRHKRVGGHAFPALCTVSIVRSANHL